MHCAMIQLLFLGVDWQTDWLVGFADVYLGTNSDGIAALPSSLRDTEHIGKHFGLPSLAIQLTSRSWLAEKSGIPT